MNNANFVHLHLHTEFSIIDGIVRIEPLIEACVRMRMPAVAITDQGNFFGLVKFYRAALTAGIKPIVGVDLWLTNPDDLRRPFRIVLLAKNHLGYRNIIRLISASYLQGQYLGVPLTQMAWLTEWCEGIIGLFGKDSDFGRNLLANKPDLAQTQLEKWQQLFADNLYLELTRTGCPDEENFIHEILPLAERYQIPVVATNDVRFISADDFEAHEARVCIHDGYLLSDPKRPRLYREQQYLCTAEELAESFQDIPEALENSWEIAKRCNVTLPLGENFLPVFPVADGVTVEDYFVSLANVGMQQRFSAFANDTQCELYQQRLQYELGVIRQMGFVSYFLIVADFIQWAKNHGVPVGPGRGSGAGSLVAYVLGITGIDPIKHELLFERFLNPERVSMPDFDIDFCMEGRDRVIEYVMQRYGKERVAQIITYGTMAARAVVRDVGRVLGYPYGFVDKLAKLIPFELGITLERALQSEEVLAQRYEDEEEVKTLFALALKLEGLTRNAGKHAGGVVIAPSLLTDFTPIYCEEGDTAQVTQFDKDDVEAIGLVKFDFLGLRTLTIIDWALRAINASRTGDPVDVSKIPLDDKKTFTLLQSGATTAVFQLESRGMKDLILRLKPDCFDDIVALVALFRPGPLQSGMVDDFIARKHKQAQISYLHPKLTAILKPTYGVILYQEQVMQIAQVLAGYTLGEADLLRRAMGKKKPEEMAHQRAIFLEGAAKSGVDKHVANDIFDLMEKFAGYGFNKSHSVAYAVITYQTAWLKAHYPTEFMAAVLSSDLDNTDKLVIFLHEAKDMQLTIIPPAINRSDYRFTAVAPGRISYGLGAVKGVGLAAVESILLARRDGEFKNLFDFCQRIDGRKVNRKVLEALIKAGAFDEIAPNRATLMASLELALTTADSYTKQRNSGQMDLFANYDEDEATHIAYVTVAPWSKEEQLEHEKTALGFYLTGHPLDHYRRELPGVAMRKIAKLPTIGAVIILGFILAIRQFNTKTGSRVVVVTLEDDTGKIDVTIFSELYLRVHQFLNEGQLLVAEGEVGLDNFSGGKRIRATKIMNLEEARSEYAKSLVLKLDADVAEDVIMELSKILNHYRGDCPVYIQYKNDEAHGIFALGKDWRVRIKEKLLQDLVAFLGTGNVVVSYVTKT